MDEPLVQRRHPRKGMYLLPGLFTSANIAFGYYAITQSMQGAANDPWHFNAAAKAIGIAIVFDALDGTIARLTKTTSDFGRELDSLADVITFGVAPAVLAWFWGFRNLANTTDLETVRKLIQIGGIASFLFLMAGASRLARFNIQKDPQPSNPGRPGRKYFVGMPIPAGAGVIAASVHFADGNPITWWWFSIVWVALLVVLAFLMVSTWRFYSFKHVDFRRSHPFRNIVLVGALIALIRFFSEYVLFIIALTYMLSGVLARLMYVVRRKPSRPPPTPYTEVSGVR